MVQMELIISWNNKKRMMKKKKILLLLTYGYLIPIHSWGIEYASNNVRKTKKCRKFL